MFLRCCAGLVAINTDSGLILWQPPWKQRSRRRDPRRRAWPQVASGRSTQTCIPEAPWPACPEIHGHRSAHRNSATGRVRRNLRSLGQRSVTPRRGEDHASLLPGRHLHRPTIPVQDSLLRRTGGFRFPRSPDLLRRQRPGA